MSNNESIKATFKDNLNKLLIEKDVTQKALADFVGVSTATVSDWKKGKKMPLMEKIDKICQFFHVERHELLNTFGGQYDNTFMTFAHQVLTPPAHEIWDYIKNETNIDVKYFAEQTGIDELNFEKLEEGKLIDYGTHKKLVDAYNAIRTMPALQKGINHAHYKIPILGTVAAGEPTVARRKTLRWRCTQAVKRESQPRCKPKSNGLLTAQNSRQRPHRHARHV